MFEWVGLVEACGKAAGLDAGLGSDEELLGGVEAIVAAERRLAAAKAHLVAEIDQRGVTDRDLGLTTAAWLASRAEIPRAAAGGLVRVARALRARFAAVDEALSEGRVGFDHARVIVGAANPRIMEEITGLQGHLLDMAVGTVFDVWRRQVAGLADLVDQDGGHRPGDDLSANRLRLSGTLDGAVKLDGTLHGGLGEAVRQAVEARADELFRRFNRDHRHCPEVAVPARATLRALALAELIRDGLATDPATSRAPRAEITLIANAEHPDQAYTPDGVRLPDGTTRIIRCDADWFPIIVDHRGVPLDAGRTHRHATPAQRRAITLRDGGCVYPGCDAEIGWCDIHHLVAWASHGPTDLANLAALCRHHHGITHRHGWTMTATPDGWFTWTTPKGHTLHSQRHHRQRHPTGPAPPD